MRRRERLEVAHDAVAEALDAGLGARPAAAPPRPAAPRARVPPSPRPRPRRRRARRRCARRWRGCGWQSVLMGRCLRTAARGGQEVVAAARASSMVSELGAVELGMPLHGGQIRLAGAGAADRLDHAVLVADALRPRSRGARSLMRLVMDAVDLDACRHRVQRAPAACPARCRRRGSCGRTPRRRGAAAPRGNCVAMSWYSVPPYATLSSCRPRQTPNTGLPAALEGRHQVDLVFVADACRRPTSPAAAVRHSCSGETSAPPCSTRPSSHCA